MRLTPFLLIVILGVLVVGNGVAAVDPAGKLKSVAGKAEYKTGDDAQLESLVGAAVKGFLSILGVLFLVLIVYGGYTWMNAQGAEEEIEKAKKIITQAVIGLIIVMASYAITAFVLDQLEGAATSS